MIEYNESLLTSKLSSKICLRFFGIVAYIGRNPGKKNLDLSFCLYPVSVLSFF